MTQNYSAGQLEGGQVAQPDAAPEPPPARRHSLSQAGTKWGISTGRFIAWHSHALCLVITDGAVFADAAPLS